MADDVTVSILREIRDSIRTLDTNLSARIDSTNVRIDKLTDRVDVLTERVDVLGNRVDLVEHAIKDCAGQIVMLTRYLKNKTEVEVEDLKVR